MYNESRHFFFSFHALLHYNNASCVGIISDLPNIAVKNANLPLVYWEVYTAEINTIIIPKRDVKLNGIYSDAQQVSTT